jgi:hypothetical protein
LVYKGAGGWFAVRFVWAALRAWHGCNSILFLNATRRSINLFNGEQKLGGSKMTQNVQAPKTQIWRGRNSRQDSKQAHRKRLPCSQLAAMKAMPPTAIARPT